MDVGAPRVVTLAELEAAAQQLWRDAPPGSVVWLTGEIGAGKTTFVQAVVRAAGGGLATSPTFALVHEYPVTGGLIVHADCYRLRDPAEALDLDFPGLEQRARLLFVEWPERAGEQAPPPDIRLRFAHADHPTHRVFERLQ